MAGIDLDVPRGMIFAILGPNGAGKTTLMRMLATLATPDAGTATVMGHDLVAEPHAVRGSIAMTGQFASLDEDLTGRENLLLLARLWGFGGARRKARADELLGAFDLSDAASKAGEGLFRRHAAATGHRRFADRDAGRALPRRADDRSRPECAAGRVAHDPWLAQSGVTILLTTQYLDEADQLAARIAVIDHGRKIAEGTSRELKAATGSGFLHVDGCRPARIDEAAEMLATGSAAGAAKRRRGRLSVMARTPAGGERGDRGAARRRDQARRFRDGLAEPRGGVLRPDRPPAAERKDAA